MLNITWHVPPHIQMMQHVTHLKNTFHTILFQDFYNQGILHPNLNKTYIALIPKEEKDNARQDFRHWLVQCCL